MMKNKLFMGIFLFAFLGLYTNLDVYAEEIIDDEIIEESEAEDIVEQETFDQQEENSEEQPFVLKEGWNQDEYGWKYIQNGNVVTGWKSLKGYWYYLDPNNGGHMVTTTATVSEKDYFFDANGHMLTGWVSLDGNWYYASSNGAKHTGWLNTGSWYYLDENGIMVTGSHVIDEKTYYFNPSGKMIKEGWMIENGNTYYISNNEIKIGWLKLDGIWYYFDEEGILVTGRQTVDEVEYFFDENGKLINGWVKDNDAWYYSTSTGKKTGWLKYNNYWYYLDGENDGIMVSGRMVIDEKDYFFNDSGKMLKDAWYQEEDNWYYISSTGAIQTGWLKYNNNWYYLDGENDGIMVTGKHLVDDKEYFFQESGKMATGWYQDEDVWYFLKSNGSKYYGWKQSGSKWYYLDQENNGIMATGMITVDGNECIFDENGHFVEGTLSLGERTYTFTSPNEVTIYKYVNSVYDKVGTDLKKLYQYTVSSIVYQVLPIPLTPPSGYTRMENYALKGLRDKQGNCYCFASTFYYLAKGLGYEVTYIEGGTLRVNGTVGNHSWVEIIVNDEKYICDPEAQYEIPSRDFYMQPINKTVLNYVK